MELTELCLIANKYGTDKCPQIKHSYTPFYFKWFKEQRYSVKKVLELGIGHFKRMQDTPVMFDRNLNRMYHRGASLYMWRDFFPHAHIYGADRVPEAIFQDERITTYLCDERKKKDLEQLIANIGSDIDIVIDDASHKVDDQIFAATTLLPLLKPGSIYIIEDVAHSKKISASLSVYDCFVQDVPRKWHGGMLFVINK